jgi:hypothetical protein
MSDAPPEYCLLYVNHWALCMTKAEWSGWVQAVGAIAAIAGAATVARYQMRQSERWQRAQVADRISGLAQVLIYLKDSIQQFLSERTDPGGPAGMARPSVLTTALHEYDDAMRALAAIALDTLPSEATVAAVIHARRVAHGRVRTIMEISDPAARIVDPEFDALHEAIGLLEREVSSLRIEAGRAAAGLPLRSAHAAPIR